MRRCTVSTPASANLPTNASVPPISTRCAPNNPSHFRRRWRPLAPARGAPDACSRRPNRLARGYSGYARSSTPCSAVYQRLPGALPARAQSARPATWHRSSHMTLAPLGEGEMLQERRIAAGDALAKALYRATAPCREGKGYAAHQRHPNLNRAGARDALLSSKVLDRRWSSVRHVGRCRGTATAPFDERIHRCAANPANRCGPGYYRALLAGSEIRHSHEENDDRVRDPYCLRCQPQVVGACLDQLRHAALVCCARPTPSPTTRWCSAIRNK